MKAVLAQTWPEAVFGEASSAAQAIEAVRAGCWDVLILDLSLPDKSGMAVLREIRRLRSPAAVLVLTLHAGAAWARGVRRAGASGYIEKSAPPGRISAAVATVLSGQTYFPE